MTEVARLGMFQDWSDPDPDEDGVFGRDIAVEGFCKALLTHAKPDLYRLFRNRPVLDPGPPESRILQRCAAAGVRLAFAEMRDLKANFGHHPFALWHDLDGNLQVAHDLRSRFAQGLYPITATPHVFSYATLGHAWILRMLLQSNYACDAMICPTPSARRSFLNLVEGVSERIERAHGLKLSFAPRTPVIPFGVDTERFAPRPKPQVRRDLDLPEDDLILLWIGRLSPLDKADLLPLIRVFAGLVASNPDKALRLLIGGSGHRFVLRSLKDYARRLGVGHRVIFRTVPAEQRHLFHCAADIFVSPADSVQETFGITPIEAMACGVPQLVSDWDGYRDTVSDGETGFRISTLMHAEDLDFGRGGGVYDNYDMFDHLTMGQAVVVDPLEMQDRLQKLIDDPQLRLRMCWASRDRALQRFDWRVVIAQYEAMWEESLEIATDIQWDPERDSDYDRSRFEDIFGHYASARVAPTWTLTLTASGRAILGGTEVLPAYHCALGTFSMSALTSALGSLAKAPLSMAEATDALARSEGDNPRNARAHWMWLMKMGMVRASP